MNPHESLENSAKGKNSSQKTTNKKISKLTNKASEKLSSSKASKRETNINFENPP